MSEWREMPYGLERKLPDGRCFQVFVRNETERKQGRKVLEKIK